MIRFQQVSLMRGIKPLFDNVDLTLNPGDKIGLIGANGAGKSSLFGHAARRAACRPGRDRLSVPTGAWPTSPRKPRRWTAPRSTTRSTATPTCAGWKPNWPRWKPSRKAPTTAIASANCTRALADADAYTVRSRAEQLLTGLGFTQEQMGSPVASFSGGWRMRLNLAQALMCPSDLLLLDEPTNHLDLDAIIWLEDWLKRYPGTLVVISHDRDFLDGVVNVIVHIDDRKLKRYSGNYSAFERQRAAQMVLAAEHDREADRASARTCSPSSTASRPRPPRRARRRAA